MRVSQLFYKADRSYFLLLVIFCVSLVIRLWLLDKRWINADEGAHLMDGVLALDGKIPHVDFRSRQPIYAYAIGGFLKVFGTHYISGRLMTVMCSLLTGMVVFLMAKVLFDQKVAVLSAAMYWMLPLEVVQSAIVKTEPLAVLLTCFALYAVIRFSVRGQGRWLVVGGVFGAMAFYVRQSAVIIPLTMFGFLIYQGGRIRDIAKNVGLFLAGYAGVVLLVLGFYSRFVSSGDLFSTGLDPVGFLAPAVQRLLSRPGLSLGSTEVFASQAITGSWELYYGYLAQAFYLHLFLLIVAGSSVVKFGYSFMDQRRPESRQYVVSHAILYLWILFLAIAYAYQSYTRGFFIDYFREFLPPLVIIFSAWFVRSVPTVRQDGVLERVIAGGLVVCALLFFMQANYRDFFGVGYHASLVIALISLFTFAGACASLTRRFLFMSTLLGIVAFIALSRQAPLKAHLSGTVPSLAMIGAIYGLTWALLGEKARPPLRDYGKFMYRSIVLASLVVSVSFSATLLDVRYDSTWSPQAVEKIASYLKAHTSSGDEVMSGGVIWEVQALRRPFHMISHPLAFDFDMSEERKAAIEQAAARRAPKAIILDGLTEQTYMRQVPWLTRLLDERYQFGTTTEPPGRPVTAYRLKEEALGAHGMSGKTMHHEVAFRKRNTP
jgi:4-amino-4-deoxy-L-arabinose transferase-like glycosyltransferase